MNEPSDEHLMALVAAGRVEELRLIYDRYESPLLSFFLRSSGNEAVSEELVQEVFLRILQYRASYDSGRTFRSWIFRIAHNLAIDAAASRKQRDRNRAPLREADLADSADDPLRSLETQDRLAELDRALGGLADGDREVLMLAKVADLRYAEIAEILQCSEGAVKVRVHRALTRLAARFVELRGDAGSERA